jgi:hypothetical protein
MGRRPTPCLTQQFVSNGAGRPSKVGCWQNNSPADFPMALHVGRRGASPRLCLGMDGTHGRPIKLSPPVGTYDVCKSCSNEKLKIAAVRSIPKW